MGIFDFFKRKKTNNNYDEKDASINSHLITKSIETTVNYASNNTAKIKKYTPNNIESLSFNEVFVFGSNLEGRHIGGAAKVALNKFGAIYGQGVGLQGQSYAIPTMHGGVEEIAPYVNDFIDFAIKNCDRYYYVTKIGCGIAGFKDEQIAPLFARALNLNHVIFPKSFVDFFNKTQDPELLTIINNVEDSLLKYSISTLKLNPNFQLIINVCPGYLREFEITEKELNKNCCNLGMDLKGDYDYNLDFWIRYPDNRIITNNLIISEITSIIEQLKSRLKETCSQCGEKQNISYRNKINDWSSQIIDQMYLCNECFSSFSKEEFRLSLSSRLYFLNNRNLKSHYILNNIQFVKKKIRFINPFNELDYANFGYYFFYEDNVYVLTSDTRYQEYDLKSNIENTVFCPYKTPEYYVIRALYAGHDTGFIDDSKVTIYTGDYIRIKGTNSNERDPYQYLGKNRLIPDKNKSQYEVFGVVSLSEGSHQAYQVFLDNHGAYLCHGVELEVLTNVFYDLDPNKKIDIRALSISFGQWGIPQFKNKNTIKE